MASWLSSRSEGPPAELRRRSVQPGLGRGDGYCAAPGGLGRLYPEAITSPDILAVSAKIDIQNDPALDREDQGMNLPGSRSP